VLIDIVLLTLPYTSATATAAAVKHISQQCKS
jgi:predicted dinucleotide-binding enzyme